MNARAETRPSLAGLAERYLLALAPSPVPAGIANDTSGPLDPTGLGGQIAAIARNPSQRDSRLLALQSAFGFGDPELLAAALAYRVETDPYFAHQIARFQEPLGKGHILIGFLASAFGLDDAGILELAGGGAVASGLLDVGTEDAVLCERGLVMPQAMLAAVGGHPRKESFANPLDPLSVKFAPAQRDQMADLSTWLSGGTGRVLHVANADREEALAFAHQLAARRQEEPVVIDSAAPAPPAWLHLRRALPIISVDLGVGEHWSFPQQVCAHTPCIIVSGLDGKIDCARPIRTWQGGALDCHEREQVWQDWGYPAAEAVSLANRYRQGAGAIARAARSMESQADPGCAIAHTTPALDLLAQRCKSADIPEDALIATPDLRDSLRQVEQRILLRERLSDNLGPALTARYRPGVRALFTGESGTGKTLAASWLSARLGLPLYRVDMAALSSKWIGETEKNLSQLLSAAETSDAILFFDEADALFGSRTDVSDSNDRHANAQTNFLLQRIEDFEGIALLTTNSRDRFDSAFVRRLDAILEFPLPDAAARRQLWLSHLGDHHSLTGADIDILARELDLAGGHIRNVVLGAAIRARIEERAINRADLFSAIADELEKLGRATPEIFPTLES
ncbi:ATP-binding protein [Parerythrobacter jejuensis]|uniref:AAA family ATPase n=1 Tax=Parerythrobacter jejuensis TaxID=795812 RepID=A0A845AZU3_9SPHN|nr:ATP-binding protein [Parerythrobacter jejuensis]MXP31256.1 AAA family ATPase [Parerythrobacter jejuensis]MXP34016.1 AAA family ATPase [Parerythrobacter jejuensis]